MIRAHYEHGKVTRASKVEEPLDEVLARGLEPYFICKTSFLSFLPVLSFFRDPIENRLVPYLVSGREIKRIKAILADRRRAKKTA